MEEHLVRAQSKMVCKASLVKQKGTQSGIGTGTDSGDPVLDSRFGRIVSEDLGFVDSRLVWALCL